MSISFGNRITRTPKNVTGYRTLHREGWECGMNTRADLWAENRNLGTYDETHIFNSIAYRTIRYWLLANKENLS